jgi:hypothetical protein
MLADVSPCGPASRKGTKMTTPRSCVGTSSPMDDFRAPLSDAVLDGENGSGRKTHYVIALGS